MVSFCRTFKTPQTVRETLPSFDQKQTSAIVLKIQINRRNTGEMIMSNSRKGPKQLYTSSGAENISFTSNHRGYTSPVYSPCGWIYWCLLWAFLCHAAFRNFYSTQDHPWKGFKLKTEIHGWHINNVFLFRGHWCSNIIEILWLRQIHIHDLLYTVEVRLQAPLCHRKCEI